MRAGFVVAASVVLGSVVSFAEPVITDVEKEPVQPLTRSVLKEKIKAIFDARDGVSSFDDFISDQDLNSLYLSLVRRGLTPDNGLELGISLGHKLNDGNRRSLLNSDWDDSDKQYTLDLHNKVRNLTGQGQVGPDINNDNWPGATDMNFLFWDDALASVAQAYSDQCIWEHNGNRNSDFYSYTEQCSFEYPESGIAIGENIAYRATTGSMSVRTALYGNAWNGWYAGEIGQGYYSPIGQCSGCGVIGHYTQMAWSKTRYLGCGFTICSDTWDGSTAQYNYYYLVCNYYSAGNYRNQYPYESGEACSNCDADRKVCSGGVCGYCMYSGWDNNGRQCTEEGDDCADQCSNNLGVTYTTDGDIDENSDGNDENSNSGGGDGSDGSLTGVIVGVCVGVFVLIVCIGIGMYFYKQREGTTDKHESFLSGNNDAEAPRGVVPVGDSDPYEPPAGSAKSKPRAPPPKAGPTYVRPY